MAQDLSEQHPILIFNPNQYLENEKSKTACLTKNEFPLRQEDEYSPFLFNQSLIQLSLICGPKTAILNVMPLSTQR